MEKPTQKKQVTKIVTAKYILLQQQLINLQLQCNATTILLY